MITAAGKRVSNLIQILPRLTWLAAASAAFALLAAAPAGKPFIRIISPANAAVIRPGQKLMVKVTGAGEFQAVGVLGPVGLGATAPPFGKQPWIVPFEIPMETDPGKTYFTAIAVTLSGIEIDSKPIEIDVEPAEIPPVSFSQDPIVISVGGCLSLSNESRCLGPSLLVSGTYSNGPSVSLNESTRITYVSQAPSIAAVSRDGQSVVGVSPGSTKISVFGKYTVNVKVYQ
jgi:hypothetical protein